MGTTPGHSAHSHIQVRLHCGVGHNQSAVTTYCDSVPVALHYDRVGVPACRHSNRTENY